MPRSSLISLSLMVSLVVGAQAADLSAVSQQDREKMQQALPDKPAVQPKKPRQVLVFTLARGFKHSSIPYAAVSFQLMGEKTGAFTATVSDDLSMFEPDKLSQFDAVIMDNTTGDLFAAPDVNKLPADEKEKMQARQQRLQQSLLDFVTRGGGLVGVHAATDCCYRWKEYGDLIGGYFWGHPWHEEVTVKLDDPGHPLCTMFQGQSFRITDEIYQFRDPYSRDKLHVLLSLDTKRTNMSKGDKIHRTDDDFAVSWVRTYGQGRVFYCSLGHRNEIFWNPTVLQHYLAGIQYACGDLVADATPSSELSEDYLAASRRRAAEAGLQSAFADIGSFKLGDDPRSPRLVEKLVIEAQQPGHEAQREVLVEKLAALLTGDTTHDCKVFACRQLRIIGDAKAVPALSRLLVVPEMSDMARYALQVIPGQAADQALMNALPRAEDKTRVGIIDSIGARRIQAAVPRLTELLTDSDPDSVRAAIHALGAIGSEPAAQALLASRQRVTEDLRPAVDHALLRCAALLPEKATALATRIDETLYRSGAVDAIRVAAFKAWLLARGPDAQGDLLAALKRPRDDFSAAAAQVLAAMPGDDVTIAFAGELKSLPPGNQQLVIDALVERGDKRVAGDVLALLDSDDETVQQAAARALETLGDERAVEPLAKLAATAEYRSPLQQRVRQTLERMQAPGIDARIQALIPAAEPSLRAELVRLLGARKATAAVPLLLKEARHDDDTVRREAYRALDRVARPGDLPSLVGLLIQTPSEETGSLESTIVDLALKLPDADTRPQTIESALRRQLPVDARVSLLDILGRIASPASLPTLYAALKDANEQVQEVAIKALADWPDSAPMQRLWDVSRTSPNEVFRILALRGYARQLALPSKRSIRETLDLYQRALNSAEGESEKKTLISGLGALRHPDAMELLKPYLDDKTYQAEAFVAAAQILEAMDGGAMKLTASRAERDVRKAVDGDRGTRWTTGRPMKPGDWFQVDMGYETDIENVMLDAGDTGNDFPRGYEVYVSVDGEQWGEPVVTGEGKEKVFTIDLPPTRGRYIKLVQTGSHEHMFWSICELRINGIPRLAGKGALLEPKDWKVTASSSGGADVPERAIDGDPDTRWTSGKAQSGGEWFQVDLGTSRTVLKLMLDTSGSGNDFPKGYEVYISDDGENWVGPIAKGVGSKARTSITVLPREGRYLKILQTGRSDHWYWSIHELSIWGE